MNTTGSATVTTPADDQILITREFDAPRHLVFKAWTTPELVMRYWAGRRGTMKQVDIDLRVGGRWRYVMEAGGNEIAFSGEYREIVPDERIAYTEVFEGHPLEGEPPLNTATFSEADGRTTLHLLTDCHTRELRDAILESGMEGGMQEQMDLLEQVARELA